MAAPIGNQFWKQRSKHGRDPLFASPELMLEAAEEYFTWCDNNPFIEIDYRGKEKVEIPRMRPYTLEGFTSYISASVSYLREFKRNCNKDFLSVIKEIEQVIYNQKYSGAASGFFNANIIARDLGLSEKVIEHSVTKISFKE